MATRRKKPVKHRRHKKAVGGFLTKRKRHHTRRHTLSRRGVHGVEGGWEGFFLTLFGGLLGHIGMVLVDQYGRRSDAPGGVVRFFSQWPGIPVGGVSYWIAKNSTGKIALVATGAMYASALKTGSHVLGHIHPRMGFLTGGMCRRDISGMYAAMEDKPMEGLNTAMLGIYGMFGPAMLNGTEERDMPAHHMVHHPKMESWYSNTGSDEDEKDY